MSNRKNNNAIQEIMYDLNLPATLPPLKYRTGRITGKPGRYPYAVQESATSEEIDAILEEQPSSTMQQSNVLGAGRNQRSVTITRASPTTRSSFVTLSMRPNTVQTTFSTPEASRSSSPQQAPTSSRKLTFSPATVPANLTLNAVEARLAAATVPVATTPLPPTVVPAMKEFIVPIPSSSSASIFDPLRQLVDSRIEFPRNLSLPGWKMRRQPFNKFPTIGKHGYISSALQAMNSTRYMADWFTIVAGVLSGKTSTIQLKVNLAENTANPPRTVNWQNIFTNLQKDMPDMTLVPENDLASIVPRPDHFLNEYIAKTFQAYRNKAMQQDFNVVQPTTKKGKTSITIQVPVDKAYIPPTRNYRYDYYVCGNCKKGFVSPPRIRELLQVHPESGKMISELILMAAPGTIPCQNCERPVHVKYVYGTGPIVIVSLDQAGQSVFPDMTLELSRNTYYLNSIITKEPGGVYVGYVQHPNTANDEPKIGETILLKYHFNEEITEQVLTNDFIAQISKKICAVVYCRRYD
jgi:hypothetical protein